MREKKGDDYKFTWERKETEIKECSILLHCLDLKEYNRHTKKKKKKVDESCNSFLFLLFIKKIKLEFWRGYQLLILIPWSFMQLTFIFFKVVYFIFFIYLFVGCVFLVPVSLIVNKTDQSKKREMQNSPGIQTRCIKGTIYMMNLFLLWLYSLNKRKITQCFTFVVVWGKKINYII